MVSRLTEKVLAAFFLLQNGVRTVIKSLFCLGARIL